MDTSLTYELAAAGERTIHGVRFRIPESLAAGTNLSTWDTGLSVETRTGMAVCTADSFLVARAAAEVVVLDGTEYSVARSRAAAAGNRYEEVVWVVTGSDPCVAVRYFIHYGVLENYDPGTIEAFDREGLVGIFDAMRRTLVLAR